MACGTGKTLAALRIAEEIAGVGGRVLYLVPSIGLFAQAMREWSEQQGVPHRYIGICSDTKAGKTAEDASILELEIPVTTDPADISEALQKTDENSMKVVFCTYHSLPIVEASQDTGAPPFDLILCDEAHRTTGIEDNDDKTSPFVLVHNADRIRAKKRLYMTATSRLYTEGAKAKAARHDIEVFSMDDPGTYGPEFHRLPFSRAVEQDLLSDYKVVVLAMSEQSTDAALQTYRIAGGKEININDATKIVGCWRALQNPERKSADDPEIQPLTRAIAFTNTIAASKNLVHHWNGVIESAIERMPEDQHPSDFTCETDHVDGKTNALNRKKRIEWLKGNAKGTCRILSNARCLSEGIDVPALDAVLFMSPRNSHVDMVQAVGRVMRKAPGKTYGYIVLPVAIPAGADPTDILNDNERFASVWNVLRALRSHDDRLNAEINRIDLNTSAPDRIIFTELNEEGDGIGSSSVSNGQQLFLPMDLPPDAIFAKIVEKCGDRKYWESWAKDVADIFLRVVGRIESLLDTPENDALREWFDDFHKELQSAINDAITRSNAIDMMAQHILTRPVFEALFENYDFASGNPVAIALDKLRNDFAEFGLEDETRDLEKFYESVRMRARGIDNSEGRQRVLLELYEKFFATALKKDAERLGIVYTPVEVVDFILHSANEVLQAEFGKSLSDEDVHILDPFTGAGIFLARLIQSGLIQSADLERKFRAELHANEIVLLAYYIAAVNIEEAFRGQRGQDSIYEPFNGIVLTDTFNLNKKRNLFPKDWLPDNNERAERQQSLPIGVIVGNPPWSAGQRRATDDNPNVEYPELEKRISETYAEYYQGANIRQLYDTYKMAIRWASDRIDEQGVIPFVTPASWIDGDSETGIRKCLEEEFGSIYVLNLLGNARIHGEQGHYHGEGVFGNATRSPVAITILVKNLNTQHGGCSIHYRDIGGELRREEKLEKLKEAVSISGFNDWQPVKPNKHHEWIEQRSEVFQQFYPSGTKEAKLGKADDAIFGLYSLGLATGRDPYIYVLETVSKLTVTSVPIGATIYVDNTAIGRTPMHDYQIDTGIHREKEVQIGLELSGYKSRVREATLMGGQPFTWNVPLEEMLAQPDIQPKIVGKDGAEMVLIPAGEFHMVSHGITLEEIFSMNLYVDAFYMDIYEVTNAQYKKFVDVNPEWQKHHILDKHHNGNYLDYWDGNNYPIGKDNYPVTHVSWYAAMAYAQWADKRLPTETEWEKAGRGGLSDMNYPWGNSIDANKANYDGNFDGPTPVGNYSANGYGLYDISGNVWEWCLDAHDYHVTFRGRIRSYLKPISLTEITNLMHDFTNVESSTERVLRGGSWDNFSDDVEVGRRHGLEPTFAYGKLGFRCVTPKSP